MVKKTRAKRTRKKSVKRSFSMVASLKKAVFFFMIGFGFVALSYIGYLDYTVCKQFQGKRWSLPAKVYASPTELFVGSQLSAAELTQLLKQLQFTEVASLATEGSFYRNGKSLTLRTRSFRFWDKHEASRELQLVFKDDALLSIVNRVSGRKLAIARLAPALIGSFYPLRKEDRTLVAFSQVPKALVDGLIATEDHGFYQHYGISLKAIARALWVNVKAGGIVQGGSTLTQQLVKNFFLTSQRSLWRKFNEALMAIILELRFEKNDILEGYLNEVYLGQNGASAVHGFGLASEFYFSQPLERLERHQLAMLVALVRGPIYYNPKRHPERIKKRRNLVLDEMVKQGYLTAAQATYSQKQALDVVPYRRQAINQYPAFLELVRRQLTQEYRDDDLTSNGLRIFTTLDVRVQKTMQQVIEKKLKQLELRKGTNQLETAVIVTQPGSGEIVALSGGRKAHAVGFNRALNAVRPIGSLIKPAIYLTALEQAERYTVTTLLSDHPVQLTSKNGTTWAPKNYDGRSHGYIPLHTALARSYNLATVRLGMSLGVGRVAKTLRDLGVKRPVKLYPSLLLGATGFTPLEVSQMYLTLAGDGFAMPLRAIRSVMSTEGKSLQRYPYSVRQTLDSGATYLTNTLLQEALTDGTGRSVYQKIPKAFNLAGKTGTTNDLRDSWFSGFSGDYLVTVWLGRDDNKPMGLTGASGSLSLWTDLMIKIMREPLRLSSPESIEKVWIDPVTRLRANSACADAQLWPYKKGSAPMESSPCVATPVNQAHEWLNKMLGDN
jgi:penicillin-binding protein 1B